MKTSPSMKLPLVLGLALLSPAVGANGLAIEVAKTPTCGCCSAWIDHLDENGFDVTTHNVTHRELNEIKVGLDIEPGQASCHTAMIDGYFIEGHVAASEIRDLISTQPEAAGLTVPGMPVGSPGMEVGDRQDAYDTLLVGNDGDTSVYREHSLPTQ